MPNIAFVFKKIGETISFCNEWLGRIVSWTIFLMMCLVLYDVIGRYFFKASAAWAMEINQTYLLPIMALLSGGYVLKGGGHVTVDILYNRFRPRARAWVDVLTSFLCFSLCFVLINYGWKIAWRDLIYGDRMVIEPHWPIFPIRFAIPIGAGLLCLQGLIKFFNNLRMAILGSQVTGKNVH